MSKPKEIVKSAPGSILQTIAAAATDPNVDAAKMAAILELQERIMFIEKTNALNMALANLTPKLERLKRTKAGAPTKSGAVKFFYTPYEEIDKMLRPLLLSAGLSLSFSTREVNGKPWFVATVTEITQGGFREAMMPYAPDSSNSQLNEPQRVASGLSYAKRYTVGMLFNLVTEGADDDANAVGAITATQRTALESLLSQTGTDLAKFCGHFQIGSLDEMQSRDYAAAESLLNQKLRMKK